MTRQDKVRECVESLSDTCRLVLRSRKLTDCISDLRPGEREMVNLTMTLLRETLQPDRTKPEKKPTPKGE